MDFFCMDYEDLGRRVRKQRQLIGWTQEKLAEKIGVSTSFVGHIERGSRKASLETLVAVSNAMEISTDYLLAGSLTHMDQNLIPQQLNQNQRMAMKEILSTIQNQLENWNNP